MVCKGTEVEVGMFVDSDCESSHHSGCVTRGSWDTRTGSLELETYKH